MAGPLSTDEIEDVVSSVRRLVSNEQRPRVVSRDLGADRLILTPSLRVVPDSPALKPLILSAQLREPIAVVAEADVSAPGAPDDTLHLVEAVWEDEIWSEPEPPLAELALGAEEAEYVAAAANVPEPPSSVAPEPWAQTEPEWAEEDPIPFVPLRRRAESLATKVAPQPEPEPQPEPAPPADMVAEAPSAQVTEPVAPQSEPEPEIQPEPETALGLEPAQTEQAPDQPLTQRMPTEILDVDGTPLAVLDEAALQAIVRLMIREELQGALGERITRNVRKLVRAEINRALTARELD